jgi:hypothetical protein
MSRVPLDVAQRQLWLRWLGSLAFLAVVMAVAVDRASQQRIGTDFHVFWQAGYDFFR